MYVIERVVVAVKLLPCIWEVLDSNLGRNIVYPYTIRGQSFQANARKVHRLRHGRFLLIPLQIIIHSHPPFRCCVRVTELLEA
jgi:hypothetical protein